ncbi:MAG: type IV pilus assembly protein PilM [Aeromonadaceae bacterium]
MLGLTNQGSLFSMVGIDFGCQTIKAVVVSGKPGRYQIDACVEVATPKGAVVDFQLQDIEKASQAIRQLLKLLPTRSKYAATAVSGSNVITKVTQVDSKLGEADLETHIQMEAEQLIPFPLDEISLDFEVLGPNLSDPTRNDVLVSAARTDSITGRVGALQDAGLQVKVVDVGLHALARSVVSLLPDLTEAKSQSVCAVVDIGAVSLTFGVMINGEIVYSRLQSFGGENFTQSIASFYSMPMDEAERAKVQSKLPPDAEMDVLAPYITLLVQQIRRNIQLFCSSSGYRELDMLVLSGGGSLLPGLCEQLALELQLEVVHPDPFSVTPKLRTESNKHGAKYMTALGLALRSFTPCQI